MRFETVKVTAPTSTDSSRERILVVDDELGPRESLRMLLKDNYDVVFAESGEEGIRKVKECGIDLVILDLKMKSISGIKTLEKMKEVDPLITVVILTGYGTLDTAQKAIRLGACDYVNKPFDVGDLLETVQKNLKKKRQREDTEGAISHLKNLNGRLEDDIKSLEKLLSSQEFFGSFCHEICNPMTSVLGYVQILLLELEKKKEYSEADRNRSQRYLRIIENELERCRLMFRNFSSFVRKDSRKTEPFPLKKLIEGSLLLLQPEIEKKGVRVDKHLDDIHETLPLGENELKQVFLNLCINALHAMEAGGTLTLRATCKPDKLVEIDISDTGHGMEEEVLQKAFKPFFTTKEPHVGSGLGLPICKGIVEKVGGSISLTSKKGEGTSVHISLPLKKVDKTKEQR